MNESFLKELARVHIQWFADPPPDPPPAGPKPGDAAPVSYASQLSPEQRKDTALMEALKAHPRMSDLVRSWHEGQQRLARAVVIPNAEKPDAVELKTFREAMGLPEKAEEYPLNAAAYKDVEDAQQILEMVRQRAFEMSLSKTQAQKLLDTLMGMSKAGREQVLANRKQVADSFEARLLETVGKDQNRAKATTNAMTAILVKLGEFGEKVSKGAGEALIRKFADNGMLYDPIFALVMAEVGGRLGEERLVTGGTGAGGKQETPKGSMGNYSPEFKQTFGERKGAK